VIETNQVMGFQTTFSVNLAALHKQQCLKKKKTNTSSKKTLLAIIAEKDALWYWVHKIPSPKKSTAKRSQASGVSTRGRLE
jgi:hypothetical protein